MSIGADLDYLLSFGHDNMRRAEIDGWSAAERLSFSQTLLGMARLVNPDLIVRRILRPIGAATGVAVVHPEFQGDMTMVVEGVVDLLPLSLRQTTEFTTPIHPDQGELLGGAA